MTFHKPTILLAELNESFRMGMGALAAHKLRSALTLLGVLIGVFSIIVVMTAMRVLQHNVEENLSQLGAQTFMIRKAPMIFFDNSDDGFEKFRRRKNITMPQVKRLEDRTTLPASIGMETSFWAGELQTKYGKSAPDVQVFGETPGSFPAHNWSMQDGRALLEMDVDGTRDVCVLGNKIAETLFPHSPALGEWLKIDGINYLIIGVLESRGGTLGGNQDNFVVMPITTGMNRYGHYSRSLNVLVQARDAASYDATEEEVRGAFRVIRKVPPGQEDDFELFSNDSMISQFNDFTRAVRIGVALVSSIALLAAGIGIMNIMLVSVTERTREIGIRRAVGAKKRNIMAQFIMEAIVLCEVGGVIGVGLGIAGGNVLALVLKLPPVIPVDWVVLGLLICSVVGVVFGTYPAFKAANLDPIESLRYE
ncbi:MAG TPA: ABC transporter permease [Verrucomicrobiae bacterium]|jgi:putative ABC transport system permease protein|nr:ABC transporter permease [Verrucomicrobiae bacterium]